MLRLIPAALVMSVGTVLFLTLAVPRLYTGYEERAVRAELLAATEGDVLDEKARAALAEGDIDGAEQFAALGDELGRPVSPETELALEEARGTMQTIVRNAADFAGAYITGHADSAAGLAGAVVSDLTVVGDVRDIISEGGKAAVGEDYSEFLLALAAVGLAAEGVTIATGGSSLVVKAGISVLKVAKRTGNLTVSFTSRLVRLARAATAPAQSAPAAVTRPGGAVVAGATGAPTRLSRTAARAELRATLGAINTMANNAGASNAVRLMRYVRTPADAQNLATLTGRFGRRSRAVVELTGKIALRSFRVALRGLRLLLAFLYSFLAWLAGLVALRLVRGTIRLVIDTVRGTFVAVALP